MDKLTEALNNLLALVISLGNLIVEAIVAIELWLRAQLGTAGVPPAVQTIILVALALLLVVGAFRLFGGLVRVAVVIVLALIVIHILMPVLHA